jgi:hypothetical protein
MRFKEKIKLKSLLIKVKHLKFDFDFMKIFTFSLM